MPATRDAVFAVVRDALLGTRPDLDPAAVREDASMRELGLDSLERLDVVVATLDTLGSDLRPDAVAGARDLGGLVDVLLAGRAGARR